VRGSAPVYVEMPRGSDVHVARVPRVTAPQDETAPLTVGFDLDLTLVDSHERILSAYIRALGDLGVEVSREELTPHLGMPLVHTAAAVGAAVDADALVLRYRHYYDEPGAPITLPMPGAAEALRCVRDAGGRTVVVSAKFTPAVHKALAEAGLAELVDVVHGELFAQDKAIALIAEGASPATWPQPWPPARMPWASPPVPTTRLRSSPRAPISPWPTSTRSSPGFPAASSRAQRSS
jgi:hypothetical protein